MLTEPTTRVNGWMTNSTGTVLNLGLMGLVMKGCTLKAKKREKGVLRLLMVAIMKDSLSKMKLADTETSPSHLTVNFELPISLKGEYSLHPSMSRVNLTCYWRMALRRLKNLF